MDEPVVVVTDPRAYTALVEQARRAGRLLAVAYGSDWSTPARGALARFGRIAQRHPDVLCAAVNVDACRALAAAHAIASVPSFRVLRDGREVGAVAGANLSVVRTYIRAYRPGRVADSSNGVGSGGNSSDSDEEGEDDEDKLVCRRDGKVLTWSGYIDRESLLDEPPREQARRAPTGGMRLGSHLEVPHPSSSSPKQPVAGSSASNVICIDDDEEGSGGSGLGVGGGNGEVNGSEESTVSALVNMGFGAEQARAALAHHRGQRPCSLAVLVDWILAHPTAGVAQQSKRPRREPVPVEQPPKTVPEKSPEANATSATTATTTAEGPAVALRVRQPDGTFVRGAFRAGHTLRDVFRWVAAHRTDTHARDAAFTLVLACPRTVFRGDASDGARTLAECGLAPAASLMLAPCPHT